MKKETNGVAVILNNILATAPKSIKEKESDAIETEVCINSACSWIERFFGSLSNLRDHEWTLITDSILKFDRKTRKTISPEFTQNILDIVCDMMRKDADQLASLGNSIAEFVKAQLSQYK